MVIAGAKTCRGSAGTESSLLCSTLCAAYLPEGAGLQHLREQQGLRLRLLCLERCFLQASPALGQ